MALLNQIYDNGSLTNDELVTFIKLLCPIAPHLTEEMYEQLGGEGFLSLAPWPEYDEAKTVDAMIEVAVQVCGKFRGTITVPADISKEDLIAKAKTFDKALPFLEGKTIVKEICVPGKLVNIVVR